jgi:hypothetical protein
MKYPESQTDLPTYLYMFSTCGFVFSLYTQTHNLCNVVVLLALTAEGSLKRNCNTSVPN